MSSLPDVLVYHQSEHVSIPATYLIKRFIRQAELANYSLINMGKIELRGPDEVLNLPHIENEFCNVRFSFFLSNDHKLRIYSSLSLSMVRLSFFVGRPLPLSRLIKNVSLTFSFSSSCLGVISSI